MATSSETLSLTSRKGNRHCGGNKVHKKIDHVERQSSFFCECHGQSASEGMNGTFCCDESCPGQKLLVTTNDAICYSKRTQENIVSDTVANNGQSLLINAVNADGSACLHDKHESHEGCLAVQSQQNSRQPRGSTLQDLYTREYYDDEDDDDSDWEPVNHIVMENWFCTNCTMPNYDKVCHCAGCGEHKDYEIPHHEFSRAQISIDTVAVRYQDSSAETGTAIGFDERMLLHSEVEIKSHPHPERPDRLRAIAASLATAGLFPGKCSLIPAREITEEELQVVHSVDHIEAVQQTSSMLSSYFTADTYANEHSACSARIAAGLCADLALSIMSGRTRNGFALV